MSKAAPYLGFALDALEHCPAVGGACGLKEEQISHALLKLWRYCWRTKVGTVTTLHVRGFFYGVDATSALVAFEFLSPEGENWHVRGSEKWLKIQKARSENGKKAAANGNLRKGKNITSATSTSPAEPQQPSNSAPALSASNYEPATSNEAKTLVDQEAGRPPDEVHQVFEHWRAVMATPKSILDKKRRAAVQARLAEGRTVEDLKAAIDGCAKTPHNMGVNDRGEKFNDLELICRNGPNVERFMRNAQAPPRVGGPAPLEQHTHTGRLEL